jgi:hypothetical protein
MYDWVTRTQSKKAVEDGDDSVVATCDLAFNMMNGDVIEVSEEAKQLAADTVKFLEELIPTARTEFDIKLVNAYEDSKLDGRSIAFLAAAVNTCRKRAAEGPSTSEHIGTVGDKLTMTVKCLAEKQTEFSWMYTLEDDKGNAITWFASSKSTIRPNQTYRVQAKIKKHDEFRGSKKTLISHVKVLETP